MTDSKILDRVAKLLAMAKDTSSPAEAAIAAERARKLMDKHQISEWDLQETKHEFGMERASKDYKFMPVWMDILSVAVAKYNDVIAQRGHSSGKSFILFLGTVEDVQIARDMYTYLVGQCTQQCKAYMHANGHGSYYVARIGDAFKKSWAVAVVHRLTAMAKERDEITLTAGTSLVVVKTAAVCAHFNVKAEYANAKFKSASDPEATKAKQAGRAAGLAHQIFKSVE